MKHTMNIFLLGFTFINLLTGCTNMNKSQASSCIPPNRVTNYAPNLQRQDGSIWQNYKPMPSWWEPQLKEAHLNKQLYSALDIVAQSGNIIWIATFPDNSENSVIRYNTSSGEIKRYAIVDQNGKGLVADQLLVSHDGNLWARFTLLSPDGEYSILARYNPQKDEFSAVTDQDELLKPIILGRGLDNVLVHPVLDQTPDGILVVVLDGEIYTYDPVTNQAKQILGDEKELVVNSISVSKDGHIWFITKNELSIHEIDPTNGTIWDYGQPPGITVNDDYKDMLSSMSKAIEIDDAGRVWVSDFGWLESNQKTRYVWHPIVRSPIFISVYDPDFEYVWIRPQALYQFSDGNMWYQSGGHIGIVRFDIRAGEWCWTATESGPLTEDSSGNLWLVSRGQIYKYKLRP
jgi:hypothetical protein